MLSRVYRYSPFLMAVMMLGCSTASTNPIRTVNQEAPSHIYRIVSMHNSAHRASWDTDYSIEKGNLFDTALAPSRRAVFLACEAIEADCYAIVMRGKMTLAPPSRTGVDIEYYTRMVSRYAHNNPERAVTMLQEVVKGCRASVEDLTHIAGESKTAYQNVYKDFLTDEDRLAITAIKSYYLNEFLKRILPEIADARLSSR